MNKRKVKILLIVLSLTTSLFVASKIYAQLQTDSNSVKTKVGSPKASECLIPTGIVTCGSKDNPRGNPPCGHCNPNTDYPMDECRNPDYIGINFAEDISTSAPQGHDVLLPTIEGNMVTWIEAGEGPSGVGVIRYYGGTDEKTGKKYWLEFHHADPKSGVIDGISGDRGAKICTTSVKCNHIHIEIYEGDKNDKKPIDASRIFCL